MNQSKLIPHRIKMNQEVIKFNRIMRRTSQHNLLRYNKLMKKTCSRCMHIHKNVNLDKSERFYCTECNMLVQHMPLMNMNTVLNPFYKLGFEMEGVWKNRPKDHETTTKIIQKGDGSVRNYNTERPFAVGEYVVPARRFIVSQIHILEKIIRDNYPTETNATTGGHFHISFKDMRFYAILMEIEFFNLMKMNLRSWAKKKLNSTAQKEFIYRLEGKSNPENYCYSQDMFIPDAQVDGSTGERYTHLNYAYQKFHTLEVRVLPQFKSPNIYLSAVDNILNTMRKYIQSKFSITHYEKRSTIKEFDITGKISTERIKSLLHGRSVWDLE